MALEKLVADKKWLFKLPFNAVSTAVSAAVIVNFLYANWSINPLDDLLYVRTAGYILPANHVSSALAVAIPAFILAITDFDNAAKWVFVIFSTASIHEFILDGINIATGFVQISSLGYLLSLRWFFWLAFVLIPAILMANKRQRQTMLMIAAFCFIYILAWFFIAESFGIDTYTIQGFAPGPAYYDFVPNFFEVTSWVIPASFWWFRR